MNKVILRTIIIISLIAATMICTMMTAATEFAVAEEVKTLVSCPPLEWPRDIVVSPDGSNLTILDVGGSLLSMSNNGGNLATIPVTPPAAGWADMEISMDGNILYISNRFTGIDPRAIYRVPVSGGTLIPIPASLPEGMHNIVLSEDESVIYIADRGLSEGGTGAILALPLSGGTAGIIASGSPLVDPFGIALSPEGDTLYIADGGGAIFSLPTSGGVPTLIASGYPIVRPVGITVSQDGSDLFIADESLPGVLRIPASGGEPHAIVAGSPLAQPQFLTIAQDGSKLYVTDKISGVFSINLLPSSDTTPPTLGRHGMKALSATSLTYEWEPATDNPGGSGIAYYEAYDTNGNITATTTETSYTWTGLQPDRLYSGYGRAYDHAGNYAQSEVVSLRTFKADVPVTEANVPNDLGNGVSLSFSNLIASGNANVVRINTVPAGAPGNFTIVGGSFPYYEITSTTQHSGDITITLKYDDTGLTLQQEQALVLKHWNRSSWDTCEPITVDTDQNTISGKTMSLSPFVIGYSSSGGGGSAPGPGISTGLNIYWLMAQAMIMLLAGLYMTRKRLI